MTLLNDKFAYSASPKSVKLPRKAKYRIDDANGTEPGKTSSQLSRLSKVNPIDIKSKLSTRDLLSRNALAEKPTPYYEFRYRCVPGDNFNLDSYLVERESSNINGNTNQTSQTDMFAQRPPTPKYVPRKTGVDRSTQVEDVNDLFDFDREVAPIVQTLVFKFLEQSMFEVTCEEELKELELVQQRCLDVKSEHEAWIQEELQKRIEEKREKELVVREYEVKRVQMLKLRTLIAGQQFVNQIYEDSIDKVCKELIATEIWKDVDKELVKTEIIPELLGKAQLVEDFMANAKTVIDEILQEIITRYTEFVPLPVEEEPRQAIVTIIHKNNSQYEYTNEIDDNEDKQEVSGVPSELIIGPIVVDRTITIDELTKTVNELIIKRNSSAIVVSNSHIKQYFDRLLDRDIAMDARLTNFNLPKEMRIELQL